MGTTHPTARADALRELSAAFNAGRITEAEYAVGWEAIDRLARPRAMHPAPVRELTTPPGHAPTAEPRPIGRRGANVRKPDLERRRRIAASGAMPPAIAARFTTGEQAALAVVAGEVRRTGRCELAVGAIAGRAAVSASTVRNALRVARRLGLVRVEERKVTAWRNDTNVVRVTSPEWSVWIAKGKGGGFNRLQSTDNQILAKGFSREKVVSTGAAGLDSHRPAEPGKWRSHPPHGKTRSA
jgi:hypothetical protein